MYLDSFESKKKKEVIQYRHLKQMDIDSKLRATSQRTARQRSGQFTEQHRYGAEKMLQSRALSQRTGLF